MDGASVTVGQLLAIAVAVVVVLVGGGWFWVHHRAKTPRDPQA